MNLIEQLVRDEGLQFKPYKDSVGKLTIGVGRNLDDVGISRDEAMMLLANDAQDASLQVERNIPWAANLDKVRFSVLVNMGFNMGIGKLLEFKKFLAALQSGDYQTASDEMLNSQWARQVGSRAQRLAVQVISGIWQ